MQHPDEGLIHAWLDGALAADEAAQLEAHVSACTTCAALVAEARGLIAASSRIVGHLDAVPGGVIPAARKKNLWLRSPWPSAIAATLIIATGVITSRQDSSRMAEMRVPAAPPLPVAVEASAGPAPDQAVPVRPLAPQAKAPAVATTPATAPTSVADSVGIPAPSAALQKAEATTPIASIRAAELPERAGSETMTRRRVASEQLSAVATTSAAGRTPPPQAAVSASAPARAPATGSAVSRAVTMADQAASEASASFAGCYEMTASTDVLPARFALMADSVAPGQMTVRYLDADGRPSERILDASWSTEGGRAVVRTAGRGTVLTLARTGSAVAATSPNGPRAGRVISCR